MDPKVFESLAKLIEALTELAKVVGSGWLAVILIGGTALLLGFRVFRDYQKAKREDRYIKFLEDQNQELRTRVEEYRVLLLAAKRVDIEVAEGPRKKLIIGETNGL